MPTPPSLLITDLDNTLWNWFDAWHASFSALLDGLVATSGLDRALLEEEIRAVHQARGTTEYSNLLNEVPSLKAFAAERDCFHVFDDALHAQNRKRKESTSLYPGVLETLQTLKRHDVRVVAYTESGAYWTEWRINHTELDGVIDVVYSSPDHDIAAGVDIGDLRTGRYERRYGLSSTQHHHVPTGATKPNTAILSSILESEGRTADQAAYLGDSLMKDIAMAQAAGVYDIHAAYGQVLNNPDYDLLRRVTHWTSADVERERALHEGVQTITPSFTCSESIRQILPIFSIDREEQP